MRILWLCNIMLPKIAIDLKKPIPHTGGWLTGLSNDLVNNEEVDLSVCFPVNKREDQMEGKMNRLAYYSFYKPDYYRYDNSSKEQLRLIIQRVKPDIVHIFGTEYPHSYEMVKAFSCPNRTVIHIQGLVSIYAKHFYANLPYQILKQYSFRDLIKHDNILNQKRGFDKRGVYEEEAIKLVNNIIGRTDWDKACTSQINRDAEYFFCNESLRDEFYKHEWSLKKCERFSIFISQANYPIKGLHYMIEALNIIIKQYPKAHLYIAGNNLIKTESLMDHLHISSYGTYIRTLIKQYNLHLNITFLGELNEKQMCRRLTKSHVFVSPSSIENSSNSVGEAMLTGVPTISSDVGGIKNLLIHEVDGFIYQYDAPYMLAYYIDKVFMDDDLAQYLAANAKKHAKLTHNREENINQLMNIYWSIFNKEKVYDKTFTHCSR